MTTIDTITSNNIMTKGWDLICIDTADDSLIILSEELGKICPDDNGNRIQYLKPKNKGFGIKGSFSFNLGLDEFPYHNETAFWTKPAQLILIASENFSYCNTLLIDTKGLFDGLSANQLIIFYNSVFSMKTPQGINFISVLHQDNSKIIFRYDPNIMKPFNSSAKIASEIIFDFISNSTPITIKWTGNNVLILNNWRFFHKRSVCNNEPNRVLKRIYINQ